MAGPWEKYKQGQPGVVTMPPKAPSGFGAPGTPPVAPIPGGPNDPSQAAAVAAAEGGARARATVPVEVAGQIAAARAKAAIDLANQAKLNQLQPKLTPEVRADAIKGYLTSQRMQAAVAKLRDLYAKGPGATHGIYGIQDFLPGEANQNFDSAASAMRGDIGASLGFTGGQINSPAEIRMNVDPYIPNSGDFSNMFDSTIVQKMDRLQGLTDTARKRAIAILGGIPDASGVVHPLPPQAPRKVISFHDLPEK